MFSARYSERSDRDWSALVSGGDDVRFDLRFPTVFLISSLLILTLLSLVIFEASSSGPLVDIISKNIDIFKSAFFMLSVFMLFILLFLIAAMQHLEVFAKVLCFASVIVLAVDVILGCGIIYLSNGLLKNGTAMVPTPFEAIYFSVMVFTSNGWDEFLPGPKGRDLVLFEGTLSFVFTPILIACLFLMLHQKRQ